jgi:hypothetical protein
MSHNYALINSSFINKDYLKLFSCLISLWIFHYSFTTVRYNVHLNGTTLSPFRPSRGLCQGDPLSPYLFLLVADCLSILVKNYEW